MTPERGHVGQSSGPERRGAVLIVTMWVLIVLAGIVMALAANVQVEADCTAGDASRAQAEAIEAGAVQYVFSRADNLKGKMPMDTDMPAEGVRLGEGAFWIIRSTPDDDRLQGYGLVDEASKLNLNTATAGMLSLLPGMTSELAACALDWRDSDDTTTDAGAEGDYYRSLADPYRAKNAPFETVEELLLVRGFTREILYGEDVNRNGILDSGEDASADGSLTRGPGSFLTLYSQEPNTDADGHARVNVNDPTQSTALTDALTAKLSAQTAALVRSRVRFGRPFRNLVDFYLRSGLKQADFDLVADKLTTRTEKTLNGLVNLMTAPREVLAALPGLEESDVTALLAARAGLTDPPASMAWLTTALKPAKAVAIADRVTLKTWQFSADIVSIAGDGRAFRRTRVVVDARKSPPKVIFRQPLTHLGWPLEETIRARLRAGVAIDTVCSEKHSVKTSTP
ncbi:MAG: type II secretion system protein GspK [Planctomycetota bacterium]|nr:type II secretion system protein GspK [Planctomycetota bacterium]